MASIGCYGAYSNRSLDFPLDSIEALVSLWMPLAPMSHTRTVTLIGVNGIQREIKVTVRVCSTGANGIQRKNQGFCASMLHRSQWHRRGMIKVTVRVCSTGANGIQREIKAAMESRGKSKFLYEYAP